MTARFKCVNRIENEQGWQVQFQATATDGSAENKAFFAPPAQTQAGGGQINVAMVSEDVAAKFRPGKSYTVDFAEVAS